MNNMNNMRNIMNSKKFCLNTNTFYWMDRSVGLRYYADNKKKKGKDASSPSGGGSSAGEIEEKMKGVEDEFGRKVQSCLEHLKVELATVVVGKASPAVLEKLPLGNGLLKAKAMVSIKDASHLIVTVFDPAFVKPVESAIMDARLYF